MSDIFVSYSKNDKKFVLSLVSKLKELGYSVWCDTSLLAGSSFSEKIEAELEKSQCVIVVWSENSIKSHWVLGEASRAMDKSTLLPISIGNVKIPLPFNQFHTIVLPANTKKPLPITIKQSIQKITGSKDVTAVNMYKFSCTEVEDHIKVIHSKVKEILKGIENKLIDARDQEEESKRLPLYLTKWRIKTPSSTYLKTKRKNYDSLDDITDYGGLRILCLFQQNIIDVHEFIINSLISDDESKLRLVEFKTFNWKKDPRNRLEEIVDDANFDEDSVVIEHITGGSGYRSVHYIVNSSFFNGSKISIEIQLRTLLQDAWGELEHSISYKQGSIHPHIKKSFKLLSRDLATNDELITHLADISNHEHLAERKQLEKIGPHHVFSYDSEIYPSIFYENDDLKTLSVKYEDLVETNRKSHNKEWLEEADALLTEILSNINALDMKDKKLSYWIEMEKAYLLSQNGKYEEASSEYEKIIKEGTIITNVTHFRFGEVLLKKGEVVTALAAFDKAEEMCEETKGQNDKEKEMYEVEIYHIKMKLALIYWQLGSEYFHISIREIEEAKEKYDIIKHIFKSENKSPSEYSKLLNNLCWYNLEYYLKTKNESYLTEANKYFDELSAIIESEELVASNTYDTCAWFCYQKYRNHLNIKDKKESRSWLNKSKVFCTKMLNGKMDINTGILNGITQRAHYLKIMSVK